MSPRVKELKEQPTPIVSGVLLTATLVKMLKVASKDASRPTLMHVWAQDGDLVATNSYVMVVYPGKAEDVPDGAIPYYAIKFSEKLRCHDMVVTEKECIVVPVTGEEVRFTRPRGTFPDYKKLVERYSFNGSHNNLNAQILVDTATALGSVQVRLTRGKPDRQPILITGTHGQHDGEPFAMLMPIASGEAGSSE